MTVTIWHDLEQQAALLKRIEEKVIHKYGHFTTKTPDHQGVRYFARASDAKTMRDAYASWLLVQIVRRRRREAARTHGVPSVASQIQALGEHNEKRREYYAGYFVHAG